MVEGNGYLHGDNKFDYSFRLHLSCRSSSLSLPPLLTFCHVSRGALMELVLWRSKDDNQCNLILVPSNVAVP